MKKCNRIYILIILSLLLTIAFLKAIPKKWVSYDDFINVTLDIKAEKDLTYQVFYTYEGGNTNFNEKDSVRVSAKASDSFQKITINLPVTTITNLRVDLGSYPGLLYINNIILSKFLDTRTLDPEYIVNNYKTHHAEIFKVKNGSVEFISNEVDPYLSPITPIEYGKDISGNINYRKIIFLFIILYCCLFIILFQFKKIIEIKYVKLVDLVISGIFLFAISIPLITTTTDNNVSENRVLASFPQFSTLGKINTNFPAEFENWFNDHYGFRNTLVRYNSILHAKILKLSPSDKVLIGKNEWLFYTNKNDSISISDFQNANLYSELQLETINRNLKEQQEWCEKQGTKFYIMVAPNKSTIYGEYYPDGIYKECSISKLDQVIDYVSKHSDVMIIDVRDELFSAKNKNQLYYKTDTHWNKYGAYYGYLAIMQQINKDYPNAKADDLDQFMIKKESRLGGDLAGMLNLKNDYNDIEFLFERNSGDQFKYVSQSNTTIITEINNTQLPRAVMFRDSFSSAVVPFLSNHFSRITYYWQPTINPKLIIDENPNMVIYELVERYLDVLLRANPSEMN